MGWKDQCFLASGDIGLFAAVVLMLAGQTPPISIHVFTTATSSAASLPDGGILILPA